MSDVEERGRSRHSKHHSKHGDKKHHGKSKSRSRSRSRSRSTSRSSRGSSRSSRGGKKKKNKKDKKKKKKKKKKGGKGEDKPPSEWSREELLDNVNMFANLKFDRSNGTAQFTVQNMRMMGEQLEIVLELFTRFSNIDSLTFKKCFITDDIFIDLLEKIKGLRNPRKLIFPLNGLTGDSVKLVCKAFTTTKNSKRNIDEIDFRENNIDNEDGMTLYRSFKDTIRTINGIPIQKFKEIRNTTLDLSNKKLKLPEVGIAMGLLKDNEHIKYVDLSYNYIDAVGAKTIANTIPLLKGVTHYKLNNNPSMTNNGEDEEGIEMLQHCVHESNRICLMDLTFTGADKTIIERANRSSSVNRCVQAARDSRKDRFSDFISARLDDKRANPPINYLKDFEPDLVIDPDFTKKDKLNIMHVKMEANEVVIRRQVDGPHGYGTKF